MANDDGVWRWSESGHALYCSWMRLIQRGRAADFAKGSEAIRRAAETTWWKWDQGSALFFWPWPGEYMERAWDGLKIFFVKPPPTYLTPQRDIVDKDVKARVKAKLDKVRRLGYIGPGEVLSLTAFFAVPKGADDIRMVYDGTVSGLNDSMWVPRFLLPTVRTMLRSIVAYTFMGDADAGDFFLNFNLHSEVSKYAGVDLTHFSGDDQNTTTVHEVWRRAGMGLRSSPYQAVQMMAMAEEFIRGDRSDPGNVFRWDVVKLNLPGSKSYDPQLRWVAKIRISDGKVAADLVIYVDDLRFLAPSLDEAWAAAHQTGSLMSFLGVQDASRKRRECSQTPGAWAGSVVRSMGGEVVILTSEEKWIKLKGLILEMWNMLQARGGVMVRKRLEEIRGFIQYVCQTYAWLTPYLMGLHLTIDGWRPGRDSEGWRMRGNPIEAHGVELEAPPDEVQAAPRLERDLCALKELTTPEVPPVVQVRARRTARAYYGFGDASGSGFGATIWIDEVHYEYGQWSSEVVENSSSN